MAPVATILVVDDEAAVRRMAELALGAAGHRVLVASGPEEAQSRLAELGGALDLVLTDLRMPRDGEALIDWVVRCRPDVPVVAMSGHGALGCIPDPEILALAKPFRIADLHECVARALERRARLRALQEEIEATPGPTCLLHPGAQVRLANRAWDRFGRENGYPADGLCALGLDYLQVCAAAGEPDRADAEAAAGLVRSALAGDERAGSHVYPCHAPWEERWFRVTARPLREDGEGYVRVQHVRVAAGGGLREA